jgi:hypothetical protein
MSKKGHCVMYYPHQLTANIEWKSKDEYDEYGPAVVGRKCY